MKGGLKRKGKEKNKGQNSLIISRLSFWQNMIFKKRTLTDKLTSVQKVANRSDFSGKKLLRRSATASTPPSAVRSVCTVWTDGRGTRTHGAAQRLFLWGKDKCHQASIKRPIKHAQSLSISLFLSFFLSFRPSIRGTLFIVPLFSRGKIVLLNSISGGGHRRQFD